MLRLLLKRLTNEKLVEYLSQTYLVKRAAQITVAAFYRFSTDQNIGKILSSNRFLNSFKSNVKKEIEHMNKKKS